VSHTSLWFSHTASKTGTKSLAVALDRLGFKPYDITTAAATGQVGLMHAATVDPDGRPYKLPQSRGNATRELALDEMYKGMLAVGAKSTLDTPFNYLYEDFLARNPKAKVIMTQSTSAADHAGSKMPAIGRFGVVCWCWERCAWHKPWGQMQANWHCRCNDASAA
jgi:hypothetical protein